MRSFPVLAILVAFLSFFFGSAALAQSGEENPAAADDAPTVVTLTGAGVGQVISGPVVPTDPTATNLQNVGVPQQSAAYTSLQQFGAQLGLRVERERFSFALDASGMVGSLGITTNGMPTLQTANSTFGWKLGHGWTASFQGGLFANQRGFEPVLPNTVSQQWFASHATPTYELAYWNFGGEFVAAHDSGNALALGYSGTWDGVVRTALNEQQPTLYAGYRGTRDWGSVSVHATAAPLAGQRQYDIDTAGEAAVADWATLRWQANVGTTLDQSVWSCGFLAGRFGGHYPGYGEVAMSIRLDGCMEHLLRPNAGPTLLALPEKTPSNTLGSVVSTVGLTIGPWKPTRIGVEVILGVASDGELITAMYATLTVFGTAQYTNNH
jgi:hypothetical protein